MHISKTTSYAVNTSVVLAMLAGCSGGSSQIAPTPLGHVPRAGAALDPTRPSFMRPDAVGKPLIFVSGAGGADVGIYLQKPPNQMVGQINGLNEALGLATDSAGNLYVADYNNSNVKVFAPPYTRKAKLILQDIGYTPFGVAVSPQGVVAVASENPGAVSFYAKNQTQPCATVVDSTGFEYTGYDAFDAKGNLYIDGTDNMGRRDVGEIIGGCQATKMNVLTTSNSTPQAQGIEVDKAGRIAILDKFYQAIYTYNPPKNGALGSPVSTTALTGADAIDFAFLASGRDVYTANYTQGSSSEFDYPAGGPAENTISVGGVNDGVAVTPPLVP